MARSWRGKAIIERADDLLVNGGLRPGREGVGGWQVAFGNCDRTVLRRSAAGTVIATTGAGHIEMSQPVRAWPNRRYRLDVHVEALTKAARKNALTGKPSAARGEPSVTRGEFVACIQARFASFRAGKEIRAYEPPAMHVGGDAPVIHRAVFQCPPGTGKVLVRLRFRVERPIVVKRVRLVETGDYLLTSHVLASPPLPSRVPLPCVPGDAILCDGRRDNRPLLGWLGGVFGEKQVQRVGARELAREGQGTQFSLTSGRTTANSSGVAPDVLFLRARHGRKQRGHGTQLVRPGGGRGTQRKGFLAPFPAIVVDQPEARGPGMRDLLAWSNESIVIVSLDTLVAAASRSGINGIRLQDRVSGVDMPCGQVVLAGYPTRGFALADTIPYAWNDGRDDFAHRYLVLSKHTKARLAGMGIRPAIVTDCGQREFDKHPLVRYRVGQRGALVVMDPDGLERPSAGEELPRVFDLLWRNALGRETVTLGQFSAPSTHYEGMMADLVELARQYDMIEDLSVPRRVHGEGNWPPTWLLPGRRHDRFVERPVLHIRTGFAEGDWPAVYGLMLWLKRLALQAARDDPAGREVLKRMRVLAWPMTEPRNWRGCPKDVVAPQSEVAEKDLFGRIDVQVGRERQAVVLVPDRAGEAAVRRGLGKGEVKVRVDPAAFAGELPAGSRPKGQLVCKVLLPGIPQAFPGSSPLLTDVAATVLEKLALAAAGAKD